MKKYRAGDCTDEELETLKCKRMISWSEWIEAHAERYPDYDDWLKSKGLRRNNRNAKAFIKEVENKLTE